MQVADLETRLQDNRSRLIRAAQVIADADALLIGAGAGMSVDSGLLPFRGKTYAEIASPQLMQDDPRQAWGFYGHCLHSIEILSRTGASGSSNRGQSRSMAIISSLPAMSMDISLALVLLTKRF